MFQIFIASTKPACNKIKKTKNAFYAEKNNY